MADTTTIILTGLITSGFTVILTKLFDLVQNERSHAIGLKEKFFEKQLFYAEKTIEYLNQKADDFDRIGLVFRQLEFISTKNEIVIDKPKFESFSTLNDYLLKDISEDFFIIKIPSAMWLYFHINLKDLPHSKLNIATIIAVNDFTRLEEAFAKVKAITPEEMERVKTLPSNQQLDFVKEYLSPLIQLQVSFQFWATSLFEARNKLQAISMKIEQQFQKYK